jgi:hypothetical protein
MACREAGRSVAGGVATTPRGIYELTLARAYLEKAREEASEAHYGSASALAQAATLATQRAKGASSGPGGSAAIGPKGRAE